MPFGVRQIYEHVYLMSPYNLHRRAQLKIRELYVRNGQKDASVSISLQANC